VEKVEKKEKYEELLPQISALIEGENEEVSVLANVAAVLHESFDQFFWTGFYLMRNGELRLGPFQGSVACMHLGKGRGVCGTAWAEATTQVVPDVEQFAGHIACSSQSRSEIVVPVFDKQHEVVAVLDIDSRELSAFDDTDKYYLEQVSAVITDTLY
jgi:GAF domain-containing protein